MKTKLDNCLILFLYSLYTKYFCEPEKFKGICATGTIEEVTDQSIKEDLWQTGWLIYYHKGKTDPDYTVLKFTSTKIEGWYNANPHYFGNKE